MANPSPINPLNWLKRVPLLVLTLVLVAQALALRAVSRPESVIPGPALASLPLQFGGWRLAQEGYVDKETRDLLQADDLVSRTYTRAGDPLPINLFVASFLSQRDGKTPHSPKNCLPGAGWVEQTNEILPLDIPGFGRIEVQHYLVANRDAKSDVMYWYQSRNRVVASEFKAKFYSMADAIRYNRTDTALIKVTTPVVEGHADQARNDNLEFIQTVFPIVRQYLPN